MNRIEKRLWVIWILVCLISLGASFGFSVMHGVDFPAGPIAGLRRALRPDREPRKIENATSLEGIQTIRVTTASTNIRVLRNEDMNDLAMTLEGRFLKATDLPLGFSKSADVLNIRVEEGILPLPWTSPFDDENRNSALTLVLPRHYAGRLKIETVSGTTGLDALVLSEFDWSSVSGELQSRTGQIQIARMKSVSGNVDFEGTTTELYATLTSADVRVILRGIESAINPKVDAQTVSGRIDIAVPATSSFRVSIASFTGEATSTVDVKRSMQSSGAYEGVIGGGTGELRMRSVSGAVRLTTN